MRDPRSRSVTCLLLAASLLAALLCLPGCGRKLWPKPVKSEDVIRLNDVYAVRAAPEGDCMSIHGQLVGPQDNLEGFTLQLEPLAESGCPTCPFFPTKRVDLSQPVWGDGGADRFTLTYCGLIPGSYRWRLAARNVYVGLPAEVTGVGLLE